MGAKIALVDAAILVAYLLLTLYIGWRVSRSVGKFEDFAVAGRTFGPFMLAATFGATNFSTWSLVGKPGLVYNSGISVVWIAWNAMACILAAVIFAPIYRKLRYSTMSEIFEDRYDRNTRSIISVLWIIADTFNRFGVTVYAVAVILGLLLGVSFQWLVVGIALVVLIYTYLGGLRSVVITDAIQFVFMWIGLFIGALFIFGRFGGWRGLVDAIPTELVEWVPAADQATGWPWILALTVLGFPYFITSQFVMQRGLAARSVNIVKWGLVFAAILAIPMAIMEIVPGLAARAMLSEATVQSLSPDMIGPAVYLELLPAGLLGLFFASLMAAGISTAAVRRRLADHRRLLPKTASRQNRPALSQGIAHSDGRARDPGNVLGPAGTPVRRRGERDPQRRRDNGYADIRDRLSGDLLAADERARRALGDRRGHGGRHDRVDPGRRRYSRVGRDHPHQYLDGARPRCGREPRSATFVKGANPTRYLPGKAVALTVATGWRYA